MILSSSDGDEVNLLLSVIHPSREGNQCTESIGLLPILERAVNIVCTQRGSVREFIYCMQLSRHEWVKRPKKCVRTLHTAP